MENSESSADLHKLKLLSVIGFSGQILQGFNVHPDRENVIYALGCTVVIENLDSHKQDILHGHSNKVTTVAVSPCGQYVASGESTHMGYKTAICGGTAQPKSAGKTKCISALKTVDEKFITAGENSCRIWTLEAINRKIIPLDCNFGQIKRHINCLSVLNDDSTFFCGTTSGDILQIGMHTGYLRQIAPEKDKFSLGITTLTLVQSNALIVGAGDGTLQEFTIAYKEEKNKCTTKLIRTQKMKRVNGGVTSVSLRGSGHQFFVITDQCHLYKFNYDNYANELVNTCHYSTVNDIKFPDNCSDLFATCSYQDIRIFHTPSQQELLRINIPNMTCYCVDIIKTGTAIVSGWNDSKIRAFYPETGRLMYTIHDAHKKGVTALASTSSCNRLVSGGGEGQVRVWEVIETKQHTNQLPYGHRRNKKASDTTYVTRLIATMKEHANAVSCIEITKDDKSCVSSSADGTCIVWCLEKFRRKQIIFANTLFRVVCYHPEEFQIITSGTDRKIGYWELHDGALIRELDGSMSGSVNGMDMSKDGEIFITGGDDKLVKVWKYQEGDVTHVGMGHSSPITRLRISPNQKFIVSVSEDGGIFLWELVLPNK